MPLHLPLLNILLSTTLVLGLCCAALLALRRAPAPWRFEIARAGLLLNLACLAFAGIAHERPTPIPLLRVLPDPPAPAQSAQTEAVVPPQPILPATADPVPVLEPAWSPDWVTLCLAGWGLGSAWMLLRLQLGLRAVTRLRRACELATDPALLGALARAARCVGLTDLPRLLLTASPCTPFALGGPAPAIVLPRALLHECTPDQLDAILVHEAAHIRHRHHALGRVQQVMLALFWWQPLLHVLTRALDAAKEEICDSHVIRDQGSGEPFARFLVELASRALDPTPATAAGILPLPFGFEARVTSLLQPHRSTMTTTDLRGALLATAFAGLGLATPLTVHVAQDRAPASAQQKAVTCSDYFPYAEGARWEYETGDPAAETRTPLVVTCVGTVDVGGGKRAFECRTKSGYDGWLYVGEREDGWYTYRNSYLGGMRGVNPRLPQLLLLCPPGVAIQWEWDEQMSVQTMAGPDGKSTGPSADDLRTHHKVTIEAMDREVKVKAGTFRCLELKDRMTGKYYGEGETTSWYAPGIGLVKQQQTHARWERGHLQELVRFTPGRDLPAVDHAALLRAHLATLAAPERGTERTITWFDDAVFQQWFKSRFARVSGLATPFVVTRERAASFDPRNPADWNQLVAAEGIEIREGMQGFQPIDELTRACALLLGSAQVVKPRIGRLADGSVSRTTHKDAVSSAELCVRGTTAAGAEWSAVVTMHFASGKVTAVAIE